MEIGKDSDVGFMRHDSELIKLMDKLRDWQPSRVEISGASKGGLEFATMEICRLPRELFLVLS